MSNNMSRRKALQLMGGGMIGAAGLMIPKMANASTKYWIQCTTSWPSSAGATAIASSYSAGFEPLWANDGDRTGNTGLWKDATVNTWGDWLEIDFNGQKTIDTIIVYTHQDTDPGVEPTDTMTFTQNGITAFDVQYWNGGSWISVGSVTGNNLVKRTFTFTAVNTTKIRVVVNGGAQLSRIVEIEAWGVDRSQQGGMPRYNVALAAPLPMVTGQDTVYPTLTQATNAKNDFKNYSDNTIIPIYQNLNASAPDVEYVIKTTSNSVTNGYQTVGLIYGAYMGTQDPNAVLAGANSLPAAQVDPHNMQIQQTAIPFMAGAALGELAWWLFGMSLGVITYRVIDNYTTLPTPQYWGWEGNMTNLNTWGQIGGGNAPMHIPN